MNTLPGEILNNIFILLPINQKQECKLVCRRWESLIRSHTLLHTININYKLEIFKDLIPKIKKQPRLGLQVFDMTLTNYIPKYFDRRNLLHLFPNLRVIKANRDKSGTLIPDGEDTSPGSNSGVYLEKIEDSFGFEMTRLVLASPSSRLVSLTLGFCFKPSTIQNNSIFLLLKNAPLLKDLSVTHCYFSMLQCETIHEANPLLESLTLYFVDLLQQDSKEYGTIVPATNVKSLKVRMRSFKAHCTRQWIHYFSKKYPNLERLNYIMNSSHFRGTLMASLYEQGYSMMIQKRLKSLELVCKEEDGSFGSILEYLDKAGCHIKELKLHAATQRCLVALSESDQSKYIEKLVLMEVFASTGFEEWLGRMILLKSFEAHYDFMYRHPDYNTHFTFNPYSEPKFFNLTEFFQSCPPTVESLTVTQLKIAFDQKEIQKFPAIKELRLSDYYTELTGINRYITVCLPNLKKLKLDVLSRAKNLPTQFLFGDHRFSSLELELRGNSYKFSVTEVVKLVTTDDNTTRFFHKNESINDYSVLDDMITQTTDKEAMKANRKQAVVVCGSVKSLYLSGRRAYF